MQSKDFSFWRKIILLAPSERSKLGFLMWNVRNGDWGGVLGGLLERKARRIMRKERSDNNLVDIYNKCKTWLSSENNRISWTGFTYPGSFEDKTGPALGNMVKRCPFIAHGKTPRKIRNVSLGSNLTTNLWCDRSMLFKLPGLQYSFGKLAQ